MKKYLFIIFLVIFILPSVAFASWWNPFSWNWKGLFSSQLKEEIQIEKQTTDSKPSDNSTTTPAAGIKKDTTVINNSTIEKKETQIKIEKEQEPISTGLLINNITISEITDTSVKISWQTNIKSESKVLMSGHEYISKNGIGTNHYVIINGLNSNSFYTGSITSISNNMWKYQGFEFTTKPSPASEPCNAEPIIQYYGVNNEFQREIPGKCPAEA